MLAAAAPSDTPPQVQEVPLQQIEVRGRGTPTPSEPVRTLRGNALSNRVESTLGATLQSELGTSNASFGPNVGLPLIRGLGGSRVRTMQDGLGTHDASTISADHSVMVEPALAERITVWRGPATIRFGGGAIGGAVEVDEGRVPTVPLDKLEARAAVRVANGNSRLGVLRLDGPLHDAVAWHADVHGRRQGRVPIRGWAIDEDAVRRQYQLVTATNTRGYIDNTDAVTEGAALGVGYVQPEAHIGVTASGLRQAYGIPPGGHSHAHTTAPGETAGGAVRIRARQQRIDLRAETPWSAAWLPAAVNRGTLRLKAAHVNYAHDEHEGGRISTTFRNDVDELRVELDQRLGSAGSATWGLQAQRRQFAALGDESFVPETDMRSAGVFALQRWTSAPWTLELGLRADWQHYEPGAGFAVLGTQREFPSRRFWPHSASLSVRRSYAASGGDAAVSAGPARQGSVTLTHWQVGRAPDVQELYAAGPHLATHTYDFGNSALDLEALHAWDLAWQHREGAWALRSNLFMYDSNSFIYQRSLGWFYESEEGIPQAACARLDHCLPATKREQAKARFHGYEAELSWSGRVNSHKWRVAAFSDRVRGRLTELEQDVPRLPPLRYGLSAEVDLPAWSLQARWTRGLAQNRPGENETPTAAYHRVDASAHYRPAAGDGPFHWSLFVVGRNLTNQTIRNSTSFLRNYAPEAGRTVEIGLEATL